MEKDKDLKEKKPANTRLKMTIGILFLVVLSIVELYLMMNYADSYLFLGLVGLAILCFVYWTMDLSFKARREQESDLEKGFESLYKAQKVSYITLKQGLVKLEELLDELGEELSFPLEEVLSAQKAVGRVTIQKNKENFYVVVASNEKLIEHLESFEQKFVEISGQIEMINAAAAAPLAEQPQNKQEEILSSLARIEDMLKEGTGNTAMPDRQQEILDSLAGIGDAVMRESGREPVVDRQQEILDYLARIEASVKDEISELEVHMESKIDEIPSAVQEEQKMSAEELEQLLGETGAMMESMNLDLPGDENIAAAVQEEAAGNPGITADAGVMAPETDKARQASMALDMADLPGADAAPEAGMPLDMADTPGAETPLETGMPPDMADTPGAETPLEAGMPPDMADTPGAETPLEAGMPPDTADVPGTAMSSEAGTSLKAGVVPELDEKALAEDSFEIPEGMGLPGVGKIAEHTEGGESYEIPEGMELPGIQDIGISPQIPEPEESYEIPEHLLMPEFSSGVQPGIMPEESAMANEAEEPSNQVDIPEVDGSQQAGIALDGQNNSEPFGMPEIPAEQAGSEKVMTPDEIAVLLGEPSGAKAPMLAEEEVPKKPDLSDPGHVMTPEEIASLLADM